MRDIVERLLDFENYDAASSRYLLRKEAAEEIQRLRNERATVPNPRLPTKAPD